MTYRIIQWATGAIGKTCLRQVIDHPPASILTGMGRSMLMTWSISWALQNRDTIV